MLFRPEFDFQALPENVPGLRLVWVVQLLPGGDHHHHHHHDFDEDDGADHDDQDDDVINPPCQNQGVVFYKGGVEPEVERALLIILWNLV